MVRASFASACAAVCTLAVGLVLLSHARTSPAPVLSESLSGWLAGTAEPWLESLFPTSSDDDELELAPADEAAPGGAPGATHSRGPSCPVGKLANAYHLNSEQGTCQQVCIGSGLRGVFIGHGGAVGSTCLELGYERFLAEGRRSGVQYFVFAPNSEGDGTGSARPSAEGSAGSPSAGAIRVPISGRVVQLVAEGDTAVALTQDGAVYTWALGSTSSGPLDEEQGGRGGGGLSSHASGVTALQHSPSRRSSHRQSLNGVLLPFSLTLPSQSDAGFAVSSGPNSPRHARLCDEEVRHLQQQQQTLANAPSPFSTSSAVARSMPPSSPLLLGGHRTPRHSSSGTLEMITPVSAYGSSSSPVRSKALPGSQSSPLVNALDRALTNALTSALSSTPPRQHRNSGADGWAEAQRAVAHLRIAELAAHGSEPGGGDAASDVWLEAEAGTTPGRPGLVPQF